MIHALKNALKFRLERFILRGAHYRLLAMGPGTCPSSSFPAR